MKIIHFLPWPSPDVIGGTELYILNLAGRQKYLGHDVSILYPLESDNLKTYFINDISIIGLPFISKRTNFKEELGINPPKLLPKFSNFLLEQKPDIFHFHCFWPKHIFYLEKANEMGIKTVITFHLALFSCLQGNLMYSGLIACNGIVKVKKCTSCLINKQNVPGYFKKIIMIFSYFFYKRHIVIFGSLRLLNVFSKPYQIEKMLEYFERINNSASALITLSPWYYELLKRNKFAKEKLHLIESNLDKINYDKVDNEINPKLRLAFVGRQTFEKGFDILLDSISTIHPEKIELHLIGKAFDKILISKLELLTIRGFTIFYYGVLPNIDVIAKLKIVDILCVPSNTIEMNPLVIKEAFALGIPVIGTNRGGIADAVKNGYNGFTFNFNNSNDLAKKITLMLDNKELLNKMKVNSSEYVIKPLIEIQYDKIYYDLFQN